MRRVARSGVAPRRSQYTRESPRRSRALEGSDHVPVAIQDRDLGPSAGRLLFEPPGDRSAVGSVPAGHQAAGFRLDALPGEEPPGGRRIEDAQRVAGGVREGTERTDAVQDVETAAVGRDHQVLKAFLNDHPVDRGRRHVELEREPRGAVVEAGPDLVVGAGEEDPGAARVFPHHVDEREGRLRDPAADPLPVLPEIPGAVDVRPEITGLVPTDREISRFGIVVRGLDELDPAVLVEARYVAAAVEPGFAAIAGHMDLPVHAAGPELAGLNR